MGQSRDRDECVWEVCLSDLHPTRSWHERVHLTTTFFMTIRLEISLTVEAMRRFFLSLVDRWSNDSWVFRQGFRFLLTWNPKIIIIMWYREQETTVHTARLHQCVCVQCARYVIYDELQTQSVGLCFIPLVLRPWWDTSRPFSGQESIIHTPRGEQEFILYRSTVCLLKKSCSYCRLLALLWTHWHSLVYQSSL